MAFVVFSFHPPYPVLVSLLMSLVSKRKERILTINYLGCNVHLRGPWKWLDRCGMVRLVR